MDDPLLPVDVDAVWKEAQPLIASALIGSTDTADELRELCRQGTALMVASERAFVVLEPIEADVLYLCVRCAASRGAQDCIKTHQQEIETCARKLGAKTIFFVTSPRRAYERVMSEGWHVRQVTWAKEL